MRLRFAPLRILLPVLAIAAVLALAGPSGPRAHAQACSNTIKDSKNGVVGCVQLHAGVVIAHTRYNGSGFFSADLQTQDPPPPGRSARIPVPTRTPTSSSIPPAASMAQPQ